MLYHFPTDALQGKDSDIKVNEERIVIINEEGGRKEEIVIEPFVEARK